MLLSDPVNMTVHFDGVPSNDLTLRIPSLACFAPSWNPISRDTFKAVSNLPADASRSPSS